jgi:hypothetical protein
MIWSASSLVDGKRVVFMMIATFAKTTKNDGKRQYQCDLKNNEPATWQQESRLGFCIEDCVEVERLGRSRVRDLMLVSAAGFHVIACQRSFALASSRPSRASRHNKLHRNLTRSS